MAAPAAKEEAVAGVVPHTPRTPRTPPIVPPAERKQRFLDFLRAQPSAEWLHRLGYAGRVSATAFLKRITSLRSSTRRTSPRRRWLRSPFVRRVDYGALFAAAKRWAAHPMNAALAAWLAAFVAGLFLIILLMTGALNAAIPDAGVRKRWTEIANQIVNALCTIMCLYQHPLLFHHTAQLLRWSPADAGDLRKVYSKNSGDGDIPRARFHYAVVLVLFHLTCFAQYAYCALYWAYDSSDRPDGPVYLCVVVSTVCPIAGGLYMIYGPLGKKIPIDTAADGDEEDAEEDDVAGSAPPVSTLPLSSSVKVVVAEPAWAGELFDLADDPTVAAASMACTFCVFGWNMERLGLGNMYVHAITFALLCAAPVVVFSVAAINIPDERLGVAVGVVGAVLAVAGLLYGGFWRGQMRKRFKLPGDRIFCARPSVADYAKWLFCAPCALAQEVRTVNFYDVEEGSLYYKEGSGSGNDGADPMAPLEREGTPPQLQRDSSLGYLLKSHREWRVDAAEFQGGGGAAVAPATEEVTVLPPQPVRV